MAVISLLRRIGYPRIGGLLPRQNKTLKRDLRRLNIYVPVKQLDVGLPEVGVVDNTDRIRRISFHEFPNV